MKRILLEWGLILCVGLTLAVSILWAVASFVDRSTYHLRFPTSRSVQDDLHLIVGAGELTLCDQFEMDTSGNSQPLIVEARNLTPSDRRRGDRVGGITVPGFDLRYYRHAPDGYIIWSLRLSLLIPAGCLFVLSFLLLRLGTGTVKQSQQGTSTARSVGSDGTE
jgi:hypothetical protein